MSQAEKESSEGGMLSADNALLVSKKSSVLDLWEEIHARVTMVHGFLSMLSHNASLNSDEGNVTDAAWGNQTLLTQADALLSELHARLVEQERPRREAAERRQKRAALLRDFTEFAMKNGKKSMRNKASARKWARKVVALHYAEKKKVISAPAPEAMQ